MSYIKGVGEWVGKRGGGDQGVGGVRPERGCLLAGRAQVKQADGVTGGCQQ
jgi:hypothetical protein